MGYQIAFDKAVTELKAKNPEAVCKLADVVYSASLRQYDVPFFGRPHIVDIENGKVTDKDSGNSCSVGAALLILHYLIYAQDVAPTGKWVTLKEIPHGGSFFYPNFQKHVLDVLVKAFQHDLSAFEKAAALLNGKQISMGDRAAAFMALPKVPLAVVLWRSDEEFGGSASFLFDQTIEYLAPLETIISFGYYLSHKLANSPLSPIACRRYDPIWDRQGNT